MVMTKSCEMWYGIHKRKLTTLSIDKSSNIFPSWLFLRKVNVEGITKTPQVTPELAKTVTVIINH